MQDHSPEARAETKELPRQEISVRRLAEMLYRSGGLIGHDLGGVEGVEGIRTHQKTIERYRESPLLCQGWKLHPEFSFQEEIVIDDNIALCIRGRADFVLYSEHQVILGEIKSFRDINCVPREGDPLHWAQATLYAALLMRRAFNDAQKAEIRLIYSSADTEERIEYSRVYTIEELNAFLRRTLREYIRRTSDLIRWKENRNHSIRMISFPYGSVRSGQREMMRDALACMRDRSVLFVQAPTGIGKTMAVLYAALKALAASYIKRIFYVTAMTSTRRVAVQALKDLREAGAMIRSIVLSPKEKSCLCPELFCDQSICPYAVSYYDRLPEALPALLNIEELDREVIAKTAEKYSLCPFELSLDIALYCDVIVGDYNHVFDPRIRLRRFFDDEAEAPAGILVDEAHNLPSRGREMFSAGISTETVRTLLKLWQPSPDFPAHFTGRYAALREQLQCLYDRFRELEELFRQAGEGSVTQVPPENPLSGLAASSDWVLLHHFLGLRLKPEKMLAEVGKAVYQMSLFLQNERSFPKRAEILKAYFELHFFHRAGEQFFGSNYLTAARLTGDLVQLYLLCLDPSAQLTECYYDRHAALFFSATLSPENYYTALLYAPPRADRSPVLTLPSPFPAENRLLMIDTAISLKYEERAAGLGHIVHILLAIAKARIGNYLVFCPSFQYLSQLRQLLKMSALPDNLDFLVQRPGMSEKQKACFLNRYEKFGERSLIGLAVLGSLFNEGIDLQGERLAGVIVIGVGLPGLSPERELMSQYFSGKFGDGFHYAYVFPGFNRVQQAVGRLIRSETDRGFALLIDSRWENDPYRRLLPEEWHARFSSSAEEILAELEAFWSAE